MKYLKKWSLINIIKMYIVFWSFMIKLQQPLTR